jgi:transcriptional regulator with XRE-family HTH domain
MDPGHLARMLAILRTVRGWTKDDLARASGVSPSSISDYERGQREPELATLRRLLAAMGYPLGALDLTRDYIERLWSANDSEATGAGPWEREGRSELQEIEETARSVGRAMGRFALQALVLLRAKGKGVAAPAEEPPLSERTT